MKIKLLKPHEHAGRQYEPGDIIELPQDAADWLIAKGVAEAVDGKPAKAK